MAKLLSYLGRDALLAVEDVGEIDAWNPDLLGKGGDGHAGHALANDFAWVAGIAHSHGRHRVNVRPLKGRHHLPVIGEEP
jgi:hypothetical protein